MRGGYTNTRVCVHHQKIFTVDRSGLMDPTSQEP